MAVCVCVWLLWGLFVFFVFFRQCFGFFAGAQLHSQIRAKQMGEIGTRVLICVKFRAD